MHKDLFLYEELTTYDEVVIAKAIQLGLQLLGKKNCWCMKLCNHKIFQGFTTSKKNRLLYKTKDARNSNLGYSRRFPNRRINL